MVANTVLFTGRNVKNVIEGLDLIIDEEKRILLGDGHLTHCRACNKVITTNNVGNISKGSKIFYCDQLGCFALRSIERLEQPGK